MDNNPVYLPTYKGQVTIPFSKITNVDSLYITNIDSLLNKINYPREDEHSGIQGGVTISFKLDSTRIAKDIIFYNHLYGSLEKSILKGLKNFKLKINKETQINNLNVILTVVFKLYTKNGKEKIN